MAIKRIGRLPKKEKPRQSRREKLALWLDYEKELVLTTEGLTDKAIKEGKLRIAYYGCDSDYGETVYVGTLDVCISYAMSRGYQP